jgi:hypothetical protein
MTTKHVVADDILGQLARKQQELTRRVLEGTLDPKWVLRTLQQLIEGRSSGLPLEETGFIIGGQVYTVDVQRKGGFETLARTCAGLEYFDTCHRPPASWLEIPDGTGPKRIKLCLAMFHISAHFGAAITKLESEGYTPADAWDLLAFFKKAPMFRTIPSNRPVIYALGTIARSYYQDSKSESGRGKYVELLAFEEGAGAKPARWSLETADPASGAYVNRGQYVLIRSK